MNNVTVASKRFQILSLDGGGIKGLFSAAVLAALEEDLNTNISDHFDLIAGTSTGGLIALGLGYGLSPKQIVEFYTTEGPKIFKRQFGLGWFKALFFRKHSQKPLKKALQYYFGEDPLFKSKKRLIVPAFSLSEDDVYNFRTPHHERLRRDCKVPIWKIALATSAAPTYLPVCREVDGARLVDGGVWANNPAMVALVEATGTLNISLPDIALFSLGTSDVVPRRPTWLDWAGQIFWGASGAAVDVLVKGQSLGVTNQVRFLLGEERFLRLNPKVANNEFALDRVEKSQDLIAKARHFSRYISPEFSARFGSHKASAFVPIYQE